MAETLTQEAVQLAETRAALAATQSRLNQIEAAGQRAAADAGIATALAGFDLHPGAASPVVDLIRGEVQVFKQNDQLIPMGPGLTPLKDFVAAKLTSPGFSHFHKTPPGSTAGGQLHPNVPNLPGGTGVPQVQQPRNMGEEAIARFQAQQASRQQAAGADPRLDLGSPMGLRRPPSSR
jgi:hypothetical protein